MSMPSSGSSTIRIASITSSFVGMDDSVAALPEEPDLLATLAREEVRPVDEPDPVAARAHHERVGPRTVGVEADAAEEIAVRDAGRCHDHLSRRELLGREDAVDVVDALLARRLDLRPRRRPQLRLEVAA